MKLFLSLLFILIVIIISLFNLLFEENKPNIIINKDPVQMKTKKESFILKGHKIFPLYSYDIKARILSKKKYNDINVLSDYDLALGWNEMSDIEFTKEFNIYQSNRWYYWNTKVLNSPIETVSHNSSNHHIIHLNNDIKDKISDLDKNDRIHLKGYLVKVKSLNNNYNWKSSITRTDTGNGACEVFLVEEVNLIKE